MNPRVPQLLCANGIIPLEVHREICRWHPELDVDVAPPTNGDVAAELIEAIGADEKYEVDPTIAEQFHATSANGFVRFRGDDAWHPCIYGRLRTGQYMVPSKEPIMDDLLTHLQLADGTEQRILSMRPLKHIATLFFMVLVTQ